MLSVPGGGKNSHPCHHYMSWGGRIPVEIPRIAEFIPEVVGNIKSAMLPEGTGLAMNNANPPRKIGTLKSLSCGNPAL